MASQTIHRKKNGAAYVYSVESYWDKEKKAPRNKQVCLGRLDEETGNIIPSGRKRRSEKEVPEENPKDFKASVKIYGPNLLLSHLANDIGLTDLLKKTFPEFWQELLSLAFFLTQKGLPLSRCELWSESHTQPFGEAISSQRVSEILKKITEEDRQRFLNLWLKRLAEDDILCYDITSVSSYSTRNEYLYWGYNRDKEQLPQINLAMLFGEKSGLPAYYRRLPGNINDVSALKTTLDTLDCLGKTKLQFVLDQGFYSESNVDTLLAKHYRFVLMAPTNRVWVRTIIDEYRDKITSPEFYQETGEGETLYMASHLHYHNKRRCYLHLYYNAARAAEDYDALTRKLVLLKKELEAGERQAAHAELYARFFIVKETLKRGLSVKYNEEEIQAFRNRYAGFFCILTNVKMASPILLDIYRQKDVVENCFDDLKNSLDMRRLRVHSSKSMDSRLFLQFLALILLSKLRRTAKATKELQNLTVREIMEAMETVVRISYAGRRGAILSESGPLQRKIMAAFGVEREA